MGIYQSGNEQRGCHKWYAVVGTMTTVLTGVYNGQDLSTETLH